MRRSRERSDVDPATNRRLEAYALAAGTAGVSLLALAPRSWAEIIYTPAHATIGRDGSYALDLNNDGKVDFTIIDVGGKRPFGTSHSLKINPDGNGVLCPGCLFGTGYYVAAALFAGSQIGTGTFSRFVFGSGLPMAGRVVSKGNVDYFGYWVNVRNRYLALRLLLSDGEHYGWARLNVEFVGGSADRESWRAQVTGYAYETTPNKPIKAGEIGGGDDATPLPADGGRNLGISAEKQVPDMAKPGTLGTLALGCEGIALWRCEAEK